MSKVGGALPAWYWPEGIPRRSPVPNQTIDRLIKRASRGADSPAIVWSDHALSFGELLATATAYGQALVGLCSDDEVVAIAESDPGEAYVLMLGALVAGKRTLILDMTARTSVIAKQVEDTGATVALAVSAGGLSGRLGDVRVIDRRELDAYDGERGKLKSTKATDASVAIPAGDELAMHSQYSLVAMAISLTAFVPELKDLAMVAPPPLWNWESLALMTAALIGGTPVYVSSLAALGDDDSVDLTAAYTVLLRDDADQLIEGDSPPDALRKLKHLFISTDYFRPRWRRELELACGREVLPIWGTAAFGPAVAAHPSWFPLDAHGIPLVNVRVVPVDPGSGEVCLVPWEMLDRAAIGVDSPAAMTSFVREGADAGIRSGKILITEVSASVDHVGVVLLHRPPKKRRGDKS